jgi:hypothetical protein
MALGLLLSKVIVNQSATAPESSSMSPSRVGKPPSPRTAMDPRIDKEAAQSINAPFESGQDLDTGTGDDTAQVPVAAEPEDHVRNTPPAGEWDDT